MEDAGFHQEVKIFFSAIGPHVVIGNRPTDTAARIGEIMRSHDLLLHNEMALVVISTGLAADTR